jgi:hypothetical protein
MAYANGKAKRKPAKKSAEPTPESIGLDTRMWGSACLKLSLRESGELIRAILRARRCKRPNRDQRMLLAIFSREEATPCSKA